MRGDLNAKPHKSLATGATALKLFMADVRLPKTSWKPVPHPWTRRLTGI